MIAALLVAVVIVAWLAALLITTHNQSRKLRRELAAEQITAANLRSTLTGVRDVRDHWKEQAKEWRKEAMEQLAKNKELLADLTKRALPTPADEQTFEDPPTVSEADRKVVDERRRARPLAGGRSAVAVADDDIPPVHRAEAEDED